MWAATFRPFLTNGPRVAGGDNSNCVNSVYADIDSETTGDYSMSWDPKHVSLCALAAKHLQNSHAEVKRGGDCERDDWI